MIFEQLLQLEERLDAVFRRSAPPPGKAVAADSNRGAASAASLTRLANGRRQSQDDNVRHSMAFDSTQLRRYSQNLVRIAVASLMTSSFNIADKSISMSLLI